jgi:hypothetical protein
MVVFVVWLYALSNVFTMGYYTPVPRKIALSVVALILPIAAAHRRTKVATIIAIMFALVTWATVLDLWIMDRPGEWMKYYP